MSGSKNRGFSLLEILVALAVFASAFVILLSAHSSAAKQAQRAENLMIATLLAREELSLSETLPFEELLNAEGDFGEDFPRFTWERIVSETIWDERLREVELTIRWTEGGRGAATSLSWFVAGELP